MKLKKGLILLLIGIAVGVTLAVYVYPNFINSLSTVNGKADQKEPLYWVAPMNPDFRKDAPGKSPMGMDLIPVYTNSATINDDAGTVRISPDVVNNLGVRITEVKYETLQSEIKTVGYVQYDEDKLIHVHPRVEGWIEKLYVKATGDPVKRGQPLYTIYSPNLVNAQEEYLIALKRKNESLIKAVETRLRALQIPAGFIQNLKKTRQVKQSVIFYAPQSGIISILNVREGFFVKPDTMIMSIGVLNDVWVQAEIFERQVSQVMVGNPVTMSLEYVPGRTWQGKVDYIYPTLDPNTRTLRVRLRFENEDRALKPNMFAQITIHTDDETPVLLVPREAVIRTGAMDRIVLALGDGSFKSIAVDIGRSDAQNIEILNGVKEGETVVTSAQFLIDSESSKTSDFKRMDHNDRPNQSVRVNATINYSIEKSNLVNVTHQAIEKWHRPEMTMNFKVDESVDYSELQQGRVVNLLIFKDKNGELVVKDFKEPIQNNIDNNRSDPSQEQQDQ